MLLASPSTAISSSLTSRASARTVGAARVSSRSLGTYFRFWTITAFTIKRLYLFIYFLLYCIFYFYFYILFYLFWRPKHAIGTASVGLQKENKFKYNSQNLKMQLVKKHVSCHAIDQSLYDFFVVERICSFNYKEHFLGLWNFYPSLLVGWEFLLLKYSISSEVLLFPSYNLLNAQS